jgi:hypothetical protein
MSSSHALHKRKPQNKKQDGNKNTINEDVCSVYIVMTM